jgi:hypothetical protein
MFGGCVFLTEFVEIELIELRFLESFTSVLRDIFCHRKFDFYQTPILDSQFIFCR